MLSNVIGDISNNAKELFIERNFSKLSRMTITNIILTMPQNNKIKMLEKYKTIIDMETVIKSLNEENRILSLKKYAKVLSTANMFKILITFDRQKELNLLSELKDLIDIKKVEFILLKSALYYEELLYDVNIPDNLIDVVLSKDVFNKIFKKYSLLNDGDLNNFQSELLSFVQKSYVSKNYISDLKALIGRQAGINYKKRKKDNPSNYLHSGIAEVLNTMISKESLDELSLDSDFLSIKYKIIEAINLSYNEQDIANYLNDFNKIKVDSVLNVKNLLEKILNNLDNKENKTQNDVEKIKKYQNYLNQINNLSPNEILIAKLLNAFNIKPGFNIIGSFISDLDLYLNYIYEIDKICNNDNINIEDIIKNKAVYMLLRVFSSSTEQVLNKSFEKDNINEGGLLTQICTFALNNEQRAGEKLEKEELEKLIVGQLSLTEKGLEKVKAKRVKNILCRDRNLKELLLSGRINDIFNNLYPNITVDNNKKISLIDLYTYMSKDNRYLEELTSEIKDKDKKSLTFDIQNYKVNESLQKQRLFFAITQLLDCDSMSETSEEFKKELDIKFSGIKKSMELINSSNSEIKGIHNLIYDDLSLTEHQNISLLLLFLDDVKNYLKVEDKNHKEKKLNIENLKDYIDRVNLLSMLSSKYSVVLNRNVIETIKDKDQIIKNYEFYLDKTSKRFYRTIPNIHGEISNNGKKINYKSYDVNDPEQLIAGYRITTYNSCFRISGFQDDTIRYITSSPNGTIIAIEDNEGNFLGRVYGYRVGNALHFTRIYYNEEFDFKEAIMSIGDEIIKNSKDIDYVTCIPNTCLRNKYLFNHDISTPDDIEHTQESDELTTDHSSYELALVSSRYPVDYDKVEFSKEEITEKFYKDRDNPKEFKDSTDLTKVYNIILRSNETKLYNYILTADKVVYGCDWVIILKNNEIYVSKIDYGNTEEAIKYQSIVNKEIDDELKKIKSNIGNLNDAASIASL